MTNDYIEIQNTLSEYSMASSKRDVDRIVATFVPDGVWAVPAMGGEFKGEAMRAAMSGFLAGMENWFQINSPAIIEVNGDSAIARSNIYEGGKLAGRNEAMNVAGSYEDELVRTPKGWRFVRRTFNPIFTSRHVLSA